MKNIQAFVSGLLIYTYAYISCLIPICLGSVFFCLFYISFYLYLVCDFEGLEIQDTCSSSQKRQDQIFNIITNVQQQHNSNHLIGQLSRTTSTTSLVSKTEKQQPPLVGQKNRTVALNHLKSVEQGNSNYLI